MTREETLSLFNRPVRVDHDMPGCIVDANGELVLSVDVFSERCDDDDAQAMAELLVDLINGASDD